MLSKKHSQIELAIECSIYNSDSPVQLLHSAIMCVIFPVEPLSDKMTFKLTPLFKKALLRIFRICDTNGDGLLDKDELSKMQMDVFKLDLDPGILKNILAMFHTDVDISSNHDLSKGLSYDLFLKLNELYIMKNKSQASWSFLFHYGYDRTLKIRQSYIDSLFGSMKINSSKSIELTEEAIQFLSFIYKTTTKENVFIPVPYECNPIIESFVHFCMYWRLQFNLDIKKAYEQLLYIGCTLPLKSLIKQIKKPNLVIPAEKKTHFCILIGSPKCGKSDYLTVSSNIIIESNGIYTYNDHHIIINELPSNLYDKLDEYEHIDKCDAFILLYKSKEESINYLRQIKEKLHKNIPKLLLQNTEGTEQIIDECEFARELNISLYSLVNLKEKRVKESQELLFKILMKPEVGLNQEYALQLRTMESKKMLNYWGKVLGIALIGVAVIAVAVGIRKR